MILWMILGVLLFGYGGMLLVGLSVALTNADAARVLDIELTKPLLITMLVITTLIIYAGYSMFSLNLLAASTVLQ